MVSILDNHLCLPINKYIKLIKIFSYSHNTHNFVIWVLKKDNDYEGVCDCNLFSISRFFESMTANMLSNKRTSVALHFISLTTLPCLSPLSFLHFLTCTYCSAIKKIFKVKFMVNLHASNWSCIILLLGLKKIHCRGCEKESRHCFLPS